jgi:hypothetical protein
MTGIGEKNMRWIDEIREDIASIHSSPKELKKFGVLIGIVLFLISVTAIWKQWWAPFLAYVFGICGILLISVGVLQPLILKNIHRYWMGFAIILGSIVSRIILFFLFYLVLTPLAVMAKVFNKRFFFSYREKKRSSYWIDRGNTKHINYERMS